MGNNITSKALAQLGQRGTEYALSASGRRMFVLKDAMAPPRDLGKLKKKRKAWSMRRIVAQANRYKKDIERLIKGWHGGPCDTDDGLIYYMPAVELMVIRYMAIEDDGKTPNPVDSYGWAQIHTPRLAAEHGREWFEEQEQRIAQTIGAKRPSLPKADVLARRIGLKHADVVQFKLVSLVGVDRPARLRKTERRIKKASAEKKRRGRNGSTAHADSVTAAKPWIDLEVSRATFYRMIERGEIPADPRMRSAKARAKANKPVPHLRLVKSA